MGWMDGRVGTALVQIRAKIRWPILRGEGSYEFWSTILQKLSDPGCSGITGMIYTVHIRVYNRPIRHTMSHVCSWSISKLTPFYQRVHTHTQNVCNILQKALAEKYDFLPDYLCKRETLSHLYVSAKL